MCECVCVCVCVCVSGGHLCAYVGPSLGASRGTLVAQEGPKVGSKRFLRSPPVWGCSLFKVAKI